MNFHESHSPASPPSVCGDCRCGGTQSLEPHHMMKFTSAKSILIAVSVLPMWCQLALSATIWTGPAITFIKAMDAASEDPENQDRLTDNVWITRGEDSGIFNIAQEAAFVGSGYSSPSPADTEWAVGTTADFGSLTFQTWVEAINKNPPGAVGQDFVVHLVTDDIYLDLRFLAWGVDDGGSFSYVRSTPVPEPCTLGLALVAILVTWLSRSPDKRPAWVAGARRNRNALLPRRA